MQPTSSRLLSLFLLWMPRFVGGAVIVIAAGLAVLTVMFAVGMSRGGDRVDAGSFVAFLAAILAFAEIGRMLGRFPLQLMLLELGFVFASLVLGLIMIN